MSETKQSVSAVDAQGLGVGLGVKVEVGFEVEVGSEGSGVEAAVRACALRMIGRNAYSVASTCQPLGLNALLVRHWLFTASQTPRVSLPELQPGREEDENDTDDTDDDDDEHEAQEDSQERVSVSRARLEPLGHVSVTVTRSSTETQTGTRTRTRRRQYLAALDAALLPPRVFDGLLARLLVYGTPPLNLLDEHVLAVVCATLCAALSVFAACDPASVTARCHSLFAQLTHLARLGDKPLPSLLEHLRTDLLAHAAMLANPLMSPFANIKRFTLDIIYAELKAILDSHSVPTNTSRHRVAAKKLDKVALAALFQVRLSDAGIQFDFSRTEFLKEAFDCIVEGMRILSYGNIISSDEEAKDDNDLDNDDDNDIEMDGGNDSDAAQNISANNNNNPTEKLANNLEINNAADESLLLDDDIYSVYSNNSHLLQLTPARSSVLSNELSSWDSAAPHHFPSLDSTPYSSIHNRSPFDQLSLPQFDHAFSNQNPTPQESPRIMHTPSQQNGQQQQHQSQPQLLQPQPQSPQQQLQQPSQSQPPQQNSFYQTPPPRLASSRLHELQQQQQQLQEQEQQQQQQQQRQHAGPVQLLVSISTSGLLATSAATQTPVLALRALCFSAPMLSQLRATRGQAAVTQLVTAPRAWPGDEPGTIYSVVCGVAASAASVYAVDKFREERNGGISVCVKVRACVDFGDGGESCVRTYVAALQMNQVLAGTRGGNDVWQLGREVRRSCLGAEVGAVSRMLHAMGFDLITAMFREMSVAAATAVGVGGSSGSINSGGSISSNSSNSNSSGNVHLSASSADEYDTMLKTFLGGALDCEAAGGVVFDADKLRENLMAFVRQAVVWQA